MARYSRLPEHICQALSRIEPSQDGDLSYFPCEVKLLDGQVLENVYIEPEGPYLRYCGVYPEDDKGKNGVRIEEIRSVKESPNRLPSRFANEIYRRGESGMGTRSLLWSLQTNRSKHSERGMHLISSNIRLARTRQT
jgi:hypothetical protein